LKAEAVDSFGIWDLIYRYLLPGWWIIPVYTTITAWIATAAWWRRAIRMGRASAKRILVVLEDGPRLRLYAFRAAIAAPFFLVPVGVVVLWYLLGCAMWAALQDGRTSLAPSWVSLLTFGYGLVGIVLVASQYDDLEMFLGSGVWYGALAGIPLGLLGLINLILVLLELATDLLFSQPDWGDLWSALGVLPVALIPSGSFLIAGWLARIGWNLALGRVRPDDETTAEMS
jgi:hypothetical protein